MERGRIWRGYPTLSKPLTIMGVERRWFLLSATLGMALWNAINSLMAGAFSFGVLYAIGFWAWKQDPNMLEILAGVRAVSRPLRSRQVGAGTLDPSHSEIAREYQQRTCGLRSGGERWLTNCPGGAGSKMAGPA